MLILKRMAKWLCALPLLVDRAVITAISVALFVFDWLFYAFMHPVNKELADEIFWLIFPLCCFSLYLGTLFTVKYRDFYYRVKWTAICFTFNNLLDDWAGRIVPAAWQQYVFQPQALQWNEIVIAALTVIIVARGRRTQRKEVPAGENIESSDIP